MSQWAVVYWDMEDHEKIITYVSGDRHLDSLFDPDSRYDLMEVRPA